MSHIKFTLPVLTLFFGFTALADGPCTLLEKNVEQRKYSFKCNKEIVNIQCVIRNKNVCSVNIREKLKSSSFEITDDQLNSFNLFSSSDLTKIECDSSKKLCKIDGNVCQKYEHFFENAKEKLVGDFNYAETKRCAGSSLGASIQSMGAFSGEVVSGNEFSKSNCSIKSDVATQALKSKISIFTKIFDAPIMDRSSFLYNCVNPSGQDTTGDQDEEVRKKTPILLELKKAMLSKMESSEQLKGLVCGPQSEIFFENEKVDVNNVMCAIIEESKLGLSDKNIGCAQTIRGSHSDRFSDENIARQTGAKLAKSDTTPLEQKPLPEAMASEVGKPIGLAPALANVDKIAPGSGVTQGVTPSETAIAAGGAINTIPIKAALQAGKVFEPIYKKFSNIAASVPTSSRTGTIGRSSPKSITGASGLVTVSQKKSSASSSDSPLDSSAVVAKTAVSATAAGKGSNLNQNSDTDLTVNTASRGKGTTNEVGPKLGGARRNNLGTSRLPSSGGGAVSVGSSANAETVSPAEIAIVQRKISQLDSPDKINSFFKQEVVNIPDLRAILYSDKSINKSLASKGIRVSNQNGDAVGDQTSNAKYIYSDTGSNFVRLNVSRRN